jgi:hypothetical protein
VIERRFRWGIVAIAAVVVITMLVGVGVSVIPFLGFDGGVSCSDVRGGTSRARYAPGASLCRQSGGKATLSVCGNDGRWTHRDVERC